MALNGACSILKKLKPWRTLASSCLRAFSWLRNPAISFMAESQPSKLLNGPVTAHQVMSKRKKKTWNISTQCDEVTHIWVYRGNGRTTKMTCLSKVLQSHFGLFPEVLSGEEEAVLKCLLLLLQRLVIINQFLLERIPLSIQPVMQVLHLRTDPRCDHSSAGFVFLWGLFYLCFHKNFVFVQNCKLLVDEANLSFCLG